MTQGKFGVEGLSVIIIIIIIIIIITKTVLIVCHVFIQMTSRRSLKWFGLTF